MTSYVFLTLVTKETVDVQLWELSSEKKAYEPESHRQKGLTPLARKWLKGGTRSLDTAAWVI